MNILVIFAHPNPKSFNAAIKEALVTNLQAKGNTVTVRDLYQMGFDPVLSGADFEQFKQGQPPADIKTEQELIEKADTMIIISPIWWFGLPAILKGYIDRVFSYGFAYTYDNGEIKGLLRGKKIYIFNTTGGPQDAYEKFGYNNALKTTIDTGIFVFCGMTVISHTFFYAVPTISDEARKQLLMDVQSFQL